MIEIKKWQPYSIGENDGELFPVSPDLSCLTARPDLAKVWRICNPDVTFNMFVLADGNILIQDYLPLSGGTVNKGLTKSIRDQLNQPGLSSCTFQIIDAWESTKRLTRFLSRFDATDTVLFFPGNGARTVFNYLTSTAYTFPASYFVSPGTGIESQLPEITLPPNVAIVDDVVASGNTIRRVTEALLKRYGIIPNLSVAAWIMLDKASISLGINRVFADIIVKGNYRSRPPINSLSCLLSSDGSNETVKADYTRRYLNGTTALSGLKQLLNNY